MLEQTATVLAVRNGRLLLETQRLSACASCSSAGCATRTLGGLLGQRSNHIELPDHLGAQPGQQVVIGIPETALLHSALLAYLLPLLVMFALLLSAEALGAGGLWLILLVPVGLLSGFLLVRWGLARSSSRMALQPLLLRLVTPAPLRVSLSNPIQSNPSNRE